MSRTGSVLSRRDRSRTGWSITHAGSEAGGGPTASALNPSFCRPARHSWSVGEAAGDGCVGAGWTGADGGDGAEPWLRGRSGGGGTGTLTSGVKPVIRGKGAGAGGPPSGSPGAGGDPTQHTGG